MSFRKRLPQAGLLLSLCLVLLLAGSGLLALGHCHEGHAHGEDAGHCALCAFAYNVAAVFLAIVSFACLPLVSLFRFALHKRRVPFSVPTHHRIRAPPLHLSTA